jgi:hypothetical protein
VREGSHSGWGKEGGRSQGEKAEEELSCCEEAARWRGVLDRRTRWVMMREEKEEGPQEEQAMKEPVRWG